MLQWNLGQPSHLDPHSNMFWTISVVAAAAAAAAISQENDALVTQQSHLIDSRTAKNLLHPLKNSINSRFLCILIITFIIIIIRDRKVHIFHEPRSLTIICLKSEPRSLTIMNFLGMKIWAMITHDQFTFTSRSYYIGTISRCINVS